jgi:hypothetical protein
VREEACAAEEAARSGSATCAAMRRARARAEHARATLHAYDKRMSQTAREARTRVSSA